MLEQRITESLINDCDDWALVPMDKFYRRLNNALSSLPIQQAYHDATLAYYAVRRYQILDHFDASYYPKPLELQEGREFLYPYQANSMDWDWDMGPGRRPKYHEYVCAMACHWMAQPNLLVAQRLFPDYNWIIVSTERHTGVACLEEKLLFEPYFYRSGSTAKSVITMYVGEELDGSLDLEVYDEENPYDYLNGAADYCLRLWEQLDDIAKTDEKKAMTLLKEALNYAETTIDEFSDEEQYAVDEPLTAQTTSTSYVL